MSTQKRNSLGRGLSALLGDEAEDYAELDKLRAAKTVPVEFLHPGKYQPRHTMDKDAIAELADSIRTKGVLQPLLVRRDPDQAEHYEIIAGERRWRAAQQAQLHEVPVIIKEYSDTEALEVGLVENLQRKDLSATEEASGYQRLMDEFNHTQEQLAGSVGKSRSHVANTLRLLNLPQSIRDMIDTGALSAGHARALIPCDDPDAMAKQIIAKGLSVRQTEKLVQSPTAKAKKSTGPSKDADTLALEHDLTILLGMRVEIANKDHAGSIKVHYSSLDQLDDVLQRLSHAPQKVPLVDEDEAVISDIPADVDVPSLEDIIGEEAAITAEVPEDVDVPALEDIIGNLGDEYEPEGDEGPEEN
jgi:ParB family transcriptional regulator, chromosome partitioning protein